MSEPILLTTYEELPTPKTAATGFSAGTWVLEVEPGVFEPCDPPEPNPVAKKKPAAKKAPAKKKPAAKK